MGRLVVAGNEGEQILMKGAKPQSVIYYIRILLGNERLESLSLLAQDQRLQLPMSLVEDDRRRCLVQLTGLDADEAVLDVVDPAHAMFAAQST